MTKRRRYAIIKQDMCTILLIIPAYNEAEVIIELIRRVHNFKSRQHNIDYVVINDGSTDDEEKILLENNINHIELIQNLGIGGAVQLGYQYALENGYDFAVQFDGDGQHDIDFLPKLLKPLLNDEADLVVGSRFIEEGSSNFQSSFVRRLGIRLISAIVKIVSSMKIKDVTSGFRACNKKVIEQFAEQYPNKYPEPESYVHLSKRNFRVKEVGVQMFERQSGRSSIKPLDAILYMIDVLLSVIIASLEKGEA